MHDFTVVAYNLRIFGLHKREGLGTEVPVSG